MDQSEPVQRATLHHWGPREGRPGPVHAMLPGVTFGQAWCGAQPQFRHMPADDKPVTCKTCLRRLDLGRPLARGARS